MPTSTLKCCEANSAMLAAPSLSAFVISSARNASSTEAPRFGFTSPQYFGSFQPPSCASAGGSSYRTGSSGNRSLPSRTSRAVCSSDLKTPAGGFFDCVVICSRKPSRSEEHTSELQSLMRISYAVFCLKKKQKYNQ